MSNMVVNTNVLAINSHRAMKGVGAAQARASARLSSGLRINSAADDAAGLAISEKMRAQIRGLDQASRNAQDGISLVQTAEGGLQEVDNMIQRIRELVVQSANDTNEKDADRSKIDQEIQQLSDEITSMSTRVEFNKKVLLGDPAKLGDVKFQVGANKDQLLDATSALNYDFKAVGDALSATGPLKTEGATASAISAMIDTVDTQLTKVIDTRAKLGAIQNRLEYTIKSLDVSSENLSASESRIRDTDMAKEMMNLTKTNVLQQAATSMLAQANQAPQGVLKLLG